MYFLLQFWNWLPKSIRGRIEGFLKNPWLQAFGFAMFGVWVTHMESKDNQTFVGFGFALAYLVMHLYWKLRISSFGELTISAIFDALVEFKKVKSTNFVKGDIRLLGVNAHLPETETIAPCVLSIDHLKTKYTGAYLLLESRELTTAAPWRCSTENARILLQDLQQAKQIHFDSLEAIIEIHVKGSKIKRISLAQCILWIGPQHNLMHFEQEMLRLQIWEKHKYFNAFLSQRFLVLNGSEIKELVKITEKRDAAL